MTYRWEKMAEFFFEVFTHHFVAGYFDKIIL